MRLITPSSRGPRLGRLLPEWPLTLFRRLRQLSERHSLWLVVLILVLGPILAISAARTMVEKGLVDALIDFWNQRSG